MIDERTVLAAIVAIAEADTGPGGLVELHGGDPHPVVEWGDEGMSRRPIGAVEVEITSRGSGSSGVRKGWLRLNAFVPAGAGDLDSRIINRWEEVLTTAALITRGIDVRIEWGGRPDLTALEAKGSGRRRALEGDITFTV